MNFVQEHKLHITVFFGCVIISFALFGNTISGDFTLDDHPVIQNRETIRSLTNIPHFFVESWHPNGAWAGNYRPLTLVTFAINWAISPKPAGFHIVNILFHALNGALIFFFVRRFSSARIAAITAFLFLFLPIHSESVASIAARNGLVAFSFIMLAAIAALDERHWRGALFFLLALFSSDSAIGFLVLVWVFLGIRYSWQWRTIFSAWWRYFFPLVIYFPIRFLALGEYTFHGQGYVNEIIGPLAFLPLWERILNGLIHLTLYIRKTFIPVDLTPDYSFNQIPVVHSFFGDPKIIAGTIICLVLFWLFFRGSERVKIAVAWIAIPFAVISNTLIVTTGTMAERWWYLPSLGMVLLLAIGIDAVLQKFPRTQIPLLIVGIVLAAWWSVLLVRQNGIWKNDHARAIATIKRSPQSAWAHAILAGQYIAERKYEEAQYEVDVSLSIADANPLAWYTQGRLAWQRRNFRIAEQAFLHALEVDYNRNTRSLNRSLALLYFDQGRNEQALVAMREAVKWPITGETKTVTAVDTYLLNLFTEYENKNPKTYTAAEIKQFGEMIQAIMGF